MNMRRVGVALVAAGAALWIVATLASPSPTSSYQLGEDVRAAGTMDAARVRISAHAGSVHSYDAANDTTYLWTSVCSHAMCGPLVPVKGDLRGRGLDGPVLLAPVDATLALVPHALPRLENETTFAFVTERSEGPAFSSVFETASPWPPFLARIGAFGLAAAGLGIALRQRWQAALPALGIVAALMVARQTHFIILVQIVGAPLGFVSLVTALAQWAIQRRGWIAAGIALGAVVALASSFVALGYFPGDGGD